MSAARRHALAPHRRTALRRAAAALAAVGLAGLPVRAAAPARVVPVIARRFVFLPSEIALRRGEPVTLEFTAPEVVMGFYAPALGLRAVIVPGTPVPLPFLPERAGSFDFLCDVFCGDGHEGMNGRIVVSD